MTTRHAVALRAFNIGIEPKTAVAKDQTILGMDRGQYLDFEASGLVRKATDEEVAAAKNAANPSAPAPSTDSTNTDGATTDAGSKAKTKA